MVLCLEFSLIGIAVVAVVSQNEVVEQLHLDEEGRLFQPLGELVILPAGMQIT